MVANPSFDYAMDKYPKLDDYDGEATEGDLRSREKALLGDDAAAEFGEAEVPSDGEFESNYPALDGNGNANGSDEVEVSETVETELPASQKETSAGSSVDPSRTQTPVGNGVNLDESEFITEWKTKQKTKLEDLDKASADKKAETREKSQKAIDDFYTNYNSKKESSLTEVRAEADKFVKDRDEAVGGGTTWDRISKLIDSIDFESAGTKPADKSRFKELVDSLKGDANAPGAAGY